MGRSRFPGKPLKFQNRKRVSVLSGVVYNDTAPESHPPNEGAPANVFSEQKEKEKKEESNFLQDKSREELCSAETSLKQNLSCIETEHNNSKSPVRTRSHNKMDSKTEKPKVKKTVTFGTVECCEDTFLPLKKLPSKNQQPLAPIIKKKSALKHTEYSTFNSILKPAILTGLSSKSISDNQESFSRKLLNPLTKSVIKFSQLSEGRCISPPPRNSLPMDKESGSKFVLPLRSTHSSRVIKPNKKFIDGEEQSTIACGSSMSSGKLLKKPKLKRIVFNNLPKDEDSAEDESEKDDELKEKSSLVSSSLFKDKTQNSFSSINTGMRKPRDLFTPFDKEYLQDENSNVEQLEKCMESQKEERSGHALRKLMDISDASSTSCSTTGSESEESWDSDENENVEEEEERPSSPEKEKAPASQLLSGKVIIREARLQLTPPTLSTPGQDGPFSSFTSCPAPNQATTVTCGVCGAVRFYKFVKQARKFGIYSCESCRKFISKMIKKEKLSQSTGPIVMHCLKREGNCHVPPIVRSQQWKFKRCANKARCPACWLKLCLKAFQVPPTIRTALTAMLPTYMRTAVKPTGALNQANPLRIGASNSLTGQPTFGALTGNIENETKSFNTIKTKKLTDEIVSEKPEVSEKVKDKKDKDDEEETNEELDANRKRRVTRVKVRMKDKAEVAIDDPKRQKMELKGPRVKHVCRSASIVLGQPIATFPTQEEKDKDKCADETLHEVKDIETVVLPICDPDSENKTPDTLLDVVKDETEIVDVKKRKVEPLVVSKLATKAESSEDETIMELVPRKSTIKPLVNISNTRGRPQKCGQNRPELICVDFWESYDPDEVCSTGFGIIGTAPFTVPKLCFLCGSAGKEKMLICSSCCEWSHTWCAEDGGAASTTSTTSAGWECPRCRECAACGGGGGVASCRTCTRHYHATCLQPPPSDRRTDWPQICSSCLKCKSCDSEKVSKFVGSLPFCGSCFRLRQKGNYCPLCQACYRDNDFDSKMMECGWCSRWVHASCEGLTGEGYQLLSALPPSIEYICRQCMPHDPPWRKMLTEHLKGRLLHLLKLLAKNRNACALLKLTPHKNTPVPNKSYRFMSPQAIRRLHFDESDTMKNTTETKVYRNTSRTRRNLIKIEDANVSKLWELSQSSKEEVYTLHKVVNLQEPLMQNKEICFSTASSADKSELESHCVEVHENEHAEEKKIHNEMFAMNVEKYEPISDDDEPMKEMTLVRSEQDLSPAIVRVPETNKTNIDDGNRLNSPSLLDIKKRVNSDEYVSVKDFNHDMKDVIERTASMDLITIYKDLFSETFPWFDCDNNCIQPNLEVEGEHHESEIVRDQEMPDNKSLNIKQSDQDKIPDQIVPKYHLEGLKSDDELLEIYPMTDSRSCILCKVVGDGVPNMEGRLLYCGQNDWIHANCALWSAEVFEEIDGSLQNVHSAISRGKMIKCPICEVKGASVGCCAKNCGETFHYACARNTGCAFLDDKRVFCPTHSKDIPKKSLQKNADFELTRPVYVELDKKKKRYSEISKVQFLLGSLTVESLGKIVPSVSDFEEFLMPVDFKCTRLFWSAKKPLKIVRYTIKTKLILAEPLPGFDFGVNITVDHSKGAQVVDRVMADIGAWHKSVESGAKPSRLLKIDKSPIKLRSKVTLEDIAVKQVVDYLLDTICRQEQQDEEEPQNTADLLPPELKDAIFEDLNHDLLDGISMQDIFPKLMSYEDLVAMDLKNEFYGTIAQTEDKSNSEPKTTTDFIDELLNAGSKELKRSKSEMLLQSHGLKTLTTGRGQQRSSSLTWSNKFDSSLLSSTIKRCKMGKSSTSTGKQSPVQKTSLLDNPLDSIKDSETTETNKKLKEESPSTISDETAHSSGINYRTTSPKEEKDSENPEKSDKTEGYFADVIDFYTKIQCSPIAQLDGAADWSDSDSTSSSRPGSPGDFTPIQQLDGADDNRLNEVVARSQTNQFLYRASGSESTYTVTIAGNSISGQPELVMRPLDDGTLVNQMETPVRCDRCQCTYRNKESYDRHIPTCDMMSTSESESENPKSPENRTLTTLQNAFQGAFAQPMVIHAISGTENTVKAEGVGGRRTSINTRQITINGTIVETPSSGQSNEMTMTITEQMKSGTVVIDQSKTTNIQVPNQQVLSSPQIVVTPQMFMPPKSSGAGQKIIAPQLITQPGMLPYNICVKPGNGNVQQIQGNSDMAHLLSGAGGIQVLSSNSNQVLTIPTNQQGNLTPIMQGKAQVTNFPNMASASSLTLPVNSIQGMPNSSIIQNIQPMIRGNIQGNPTIVVPNMTQRFTTPNAHHKQQILISTAHQRSPKKQPTPVQPKPIFQASNKPRGRPMPKPTTIKRQTKLEKTFTTINQPLGGNTVIQLQPNNQQGQPSIIVQPVGNQNLMSAYVEALSQQQNQNMQYLTIAPQNEYKAAPTTQFISQGGLMPQTFQIQQTENGGLVAVPSGGIPVLLPQGNVGILPQTLQQGATILPQGLQQGIISQGPNGHTLLPQTIQNGTIIPQGTLQGLTQGNSLHTAGATVVPQSGISNGQTTIIPNGQGNAIISSTPGTIIPQGTILPQFCNDQVILGSTPTLEMVTDSSGCMYLTATQPVYYGLETIVQNTVMSSQQFVSTAMQGVLAQNSSFSATTTQVFQASKIEPIVEVPTGYVVVNNVGDNVNQVTSSANVVSTHNVQTQPQPLKTKTPVPNLTLQPLPDKPNNNRQAPKVIQMSAAPVIIGSSGTIMTGRQSVNPITSQIYSLSLVSTPQNIVRTTATKQMVPNVTLISSTGQPVMAISQSVPNSTSSFSLQSIPLSQPIVSSSIAPSIAKNMHPPKTETPHLIEIGGNLQDSSNLHSHNTISVPQNLKSPTPWRQVSAVCSNSESNKPIDQQSSSVKVLSCTTINPQQNHMISNRNITQQNEGEKSNQICITPAPLNATSIGTTSHSHQFDSSINVSHQSTSYGHNNVIQISSGSIYPPPPALTTSFDAETAIKLSKINTLSKTEGGHMNFSQEIMAPHSQQHATNERAFQIIGNTDKTNVENMLSQMNNMNMPKLSSCQLSGNSNLNVLRQQSQNASSVHNNQMCSMTTSNNSQVMQISNSESNMNMSCQESSNNRSSCSNETIMRSPNCGNQQHDGALLSPIQHGNVPMMSHELNHHPTNQIHIMNGQIQHNNSTQMPQSNNIINMGSARAFHENHAQPVPNRVTPDNLHNQNLNIHNVGNNHNHNRSQSDMSHMHMPQPLGNMNSNMQNRHSLENMACHDMNNIGMQMHPNRTMENMHSQIANHGMSQMNHHMNANSRQIDSNMHQHQQMPLPQNRQMDTTAHHHQHQMPNVMQIQSNRQHIESNMMGHHHMPNQMHNRQLDNSIHMHHNMTGNPGNMTPIPPIHNRHDNNPMSMQNLNPINQMQSNRSGLEHQAHLHQINNMNTMNNMNMHSNMSNSMQMGNNHQPMIQVQSIANNIPDIKNDLQNSCSGSCSTNNMQFGNQSQFDMCASNTNMNMGSSNMMHGMNMNNSNIMMNNSYNQQPVGHDMLMPCNNATDIMTANSNHMLMNNSQNLNNTQININSCMNSSNSAQNQMANVDPQINRPNITINEQPKFVPEPCRGKNIGPMQSVSNNDCAKVNMINNDKQNHTISVNNQNVGFMSMNSQNNRVINLPNNRMNNNNLESNQHLAQQHNIRVVTNNNNNGAIASDNLSFQQKNENSTMINVPFQAIPNSVPMNINVNSSNNTVNITVQNNLVDPKIASKAAADINFPLQPNSNMLPNQNNNANMICIPVQNNTINLPSQSTTSIKLPKAPPTQKPGIPTNVANSTSMRPMNRVLPLHRDGQSTVAKAVAKPASTPRPRPASQDMPDLNIKDETTDSDLEKAIEESKRMMELDRVKRQKEEEETALAIQATAQSVPCLSSTNASSLPPLPITAPKMLSLPSLDAEIEEQPKILSDKDINRLPQPKPSVASKILKRQAERKIDSEPPATKKSSKISKGQENILKGASGRKYSPEPPKDDGPKLIYEVTSDDGFNYTSTSLSDLWAKVVEAVQNARKAAGLPVLNYNLASSLSGAHLIGLNNNGLRYLIEQLPGVSRCAKYKAKQGRLLNSWDNDLDLSEGFKESSWGSARIGPVVRKHNHDMFSWMASPFREEPPPVGAQEGESLVSRRLATLPLAMRFRHLKETSKVSVGIYRSHIHGRGLFCKKDIEEGDMVIEYAGEVIRAVLADQREKRYEAMRGRRGVADCYMFRIDDNLVVDATLKGNAARFINHSCDPNCYSRVVDIHGHKHILIFALRRISVGEELTYDYKFPFEDVKIPCMCGAKKCRKYLN